MKVLEKYAGAKRGNYSTLPKHDVEILPDVHHCEKCGGIVVYQDPPGSSYSLGVWKHEGGPGGCVNSEGLEGYVCPKTRCRYCHSEAAKYMQHAWHDAIECPRCGGVDGYAIGD